MVLEELGPTFIKFGQLLSTRPDLLTTPYLEELGKLQDEVQPVPFDEIQATLEEEFQGRVKDRFRSIDSVPVAAASIAQVHRAVTVGGEDVVVKVRKRGLSKVIEQDLLVLGLLTDFLRGWPGLRLFDPEGVLRVFERSIRRELNFDFERNNLLRLRENLDEDSKVYLPKVYPELSTTGILTMEFLHGEKLTFYQRRQLPRDRGEDTARNLALCILQQIFEHGLFHADPHPGNIILMEDGRVGLIDVGNVGRMTPEMMDDLIVLLVTLVQQDYRRVARWILRHGRPTADVDPDTLAMDLMDHLDPYFGLSLEEIRVGDLFNALFGMVMRYGIRIPPQYVTVGRTFVTLEGSVRLCAPGLEVMPHLQPYVTEILRSRWAPGRLAREFESQLTDLFSVLKSFPANLAEVLARTAEGRLRVETHNPDLERVERKIDVIGARVPMAIFGGALLLGSVAFLCIPKDWEVGAWTPVLGLAGLVTTFFLGLRIFLR